jgi:hypothetical protein
MPKKATRYSQVPKYFFHFQLIARLLVFMSYKNIEIGFSQYLNSIFLSYEILQSSSVAQHQISVSLFIAIFIHHP